MRPAVELSVLMTAYNVEKYIAEAIRSVLEQSFTAFEFIIVNDGSTDRTEEIIRSFSDARIRLVNQSNNGVAAALNKGLDMARSPYIVRFDADDICYAGRLEKQFRFMQSHPDHIVAGSAADYIDEKGEYVFTNYPPAFEDEDIQDVKQRACPFIHSSVIFRKEAIMHYGGYEEKAHSFEDHLLWVKATGKGKGYNFTEPLIKVRLNPGSVTIDEQWRPRAFHQIKGRVLRRKNITEEEGQTLLAIIRSQDQAPFKESAYHALLAKKFLWNNYQPRKARQNLARVIARNRLHWKSYCFYLLSYLPEKWLRISYRVLKAPSTSFEKEKNAG